MAWNGEITQFYMIEDARQDGGFGDSLHHFYIRNNIIMSLGYGPPANPIYLAHDYSDSIFFEHNTVDSSVAYIGTFENHGAGLIKHNLFHLTSVDGYTSFYYDATSGGWLDSNHYNVAPAVYTYPGGAGFETHRTTGTIHYTDSTSRFPPGADGVPWTSDDAFKLTTQIAGDPGAYAWSSATATNNHKISITATLRTP
jgi:hypothetical protein